MYHHRRNLYAWMINTYTPRPTCFPFALHTDMPTILRSTTFTRVLVNHSSLRVLEYAVLSSIRLCFRSYTTREARIGQRSVLDHYGQYVFMSCIWKRVCSHEADLHSIAFDLIPLHVELFEFSTDNVHLQIWLFNKVLLNLPIKIPYQITIIQGMQYRTR